MNSKIIVLIGLAMISIVARSQVVSEINGKLKISKQEVASIEVILYNNNFRDTTFADTTLSFYLKNIPNGVYSMIVNTNYTKTGRRNLVVTDILIDKGGSSIDMSEIQLSGVRTCGCGAFFLGKKDTVEYYKSGEIYGSGRYKIRKKYYHQYKSRLYSYRKHGVWNYYYKSGKLLRQAIYDSDYLVSFIEYYENGAKKMIGYYDDCKSGIWEYYSDSEELIFVVDFSHKFTTKISYKYLNGYMDNFEMMERL